MLRAAPNVVSTHMNCHQKRRQTFKDHFMLWRRQRDCRNEFWDEIPVCSVLLLSQTCPLLAHLLSYLLFNNVTNIMYFLTLPQSTSLISLLPPPKSFFPTLAQHWSQQYRPCPELNNIYLTRNSTMYTLHQAQQYTPSTMGLWKPTPNTLSWFLGLSINFSRHLNLKPLLESVLQYLESAGLFS